MLQRWSAICSRWKSEDACFSSWLGLSLNSSSQTERVQLHLKKFTCVYESRHENNGRAKKTEAQKGGNLLHSPLSLKISVVLAIDRVARVQVHLLILEYATRLCASFSIISRIKLARDSLGFHGISPDVCRILQGRLVHKQHARFAARVQLDVHFIWFFSRLFNSCTLDLLDLPQFCNCHW